MTAAQLTVADEAVMLAVDVLAGTAQDACVVKYVLVVYALTDPLLHEVATIHTYCVDAVRPVSVNDVDVLVTYVHPLVEALGLYAT